MPKEEFWGEDKIDGDEPDISVSWGTTDDPKILINGSRYDRSGVNRLIKSLRRARNQVYGPDE